MAADGDEQMFDSGNVEADNETLQMHIDLLQKQLAKARAEARDNAARTSQMDAMIRERDKYRAVSCGIIRHIRQSG